MGGHVGVVVMEGVKSCESGRYLFTSCTLCYEIDEDSFEILSGHSSIASVSLLTYALRAAGCPKANALF